jgi:hypothetical protein
MSTQSCGVNSTLSVAPAALSLPLRRGLCLFLTRQINERLTSCRQRAEPSVLNSHLLRPGQGPRLSAGGSSRVCCQTVINRSLARTQRMSTLAAGLRAPARYSARWIGRSGRFEFLSEYQLVRYAFEFLSEYHLETFVLPNQAITASI